MLIKIKSLSFRFLLILPLLIPVAFSQNAHPEHDEHEGHDHGPHEGHGHPSMENSEPAPNSDSHLMSAIQKIQPTASLDLVSDVYTSNSQDRAFNVNVRSAELRLQGAIDKDFEGTLSFAGHNENNQFIFDLHEGYVSSSTFIPSSSFKVGKFLLGLGYLNRSHQHEWAFTSAPKVHREFFATEATADTGVEYTYRLPTSKSLEITAGVTSGYCYGHCHGSGNKPPRPLYYLHPVATFDLSPASSLQAGLSYLTRRDHLQVETHLSGFDLVFKQYHANYLRWLVQSEAYYQEQAGGSSASLKQVGAYHLTQYGFNENWFLGLRLDAFSELSKKFQTTGERRKDFDYAVVPILSWKPSESATLRFSYTFDVDTTQGDADKFGHLAQVQFNFVLGAHPEHH